MGRPVWVRKRAATTVCPVSYITPQSLAWIERFSVWKLMGGAKLESLPARTVEALCVLENEFRKETSDGGQ